VYFFSALRVAAASAAEPAFVAESPILLLLLQQQQQQRVTYHYHHGLSCECFRSVWATLVVLSSAAFLYMAYDCVALYINNATEHAETARLPPITICNINPLRSPVFTRATLG